MKKIISLIMLVMLIAGCGTSKVNDGSNTGNSTSNKPNNNKKLVCSSKYEQDETTLRTMKYTLIYDFEGKKLETLIHDDTMEYTDTVFSDMYIKRMQEYCDDVNIKNGLACEYNPEHNSKISKITLKVDYANLDSKSREFLAEEEEYLEAENLSLEEAKKYIEENEDYKCEVE